MLAQNLEDTEAVVNDEHGHELVPGLMGDNTTITYTIRQRRTYNCLG